MSSSAPDENEDAAAVLFKHGIESCNPEMIREAVSRGARIDQLSGRKVAPLAVALNQCARFLPRAEESLATLVELGYPIDGRPEETPTVLECTASYREEGDALRLLKIVVPLGANVNAVSPSGQTALFGAVAHDWRTVVEFLRDHGANPTIKDSRGISAIDWLQAKIADSARMFSECFKHRRVLSLLTGEPIPPSEIIRPQLAESLSVDLARITADARFFADLQGAPDDLRHFSFEIQKKLGVSIEPLIDHIAALCEANAAGELAASSLAQIAASLPGWQQPRETMALADLWTVSLLETIVQSAIASGAAPSSDMGESLGQTWTQDLHRRIGDRGFRLLLAGGCRYAFRPYIKSQPPGVYRVAYDAIETLEQFADTGKGTTALKRAQKDMAETFGPRLSVQDNGLHLAFALEVSLKAPQYVWSRIEERFGLSGIQGLREFVRLSRDVAGPLKSHGPFDKVWRTPQVVELATQMYETRDFRTMFELADALEQAGCNDKSILNHCRDPQWIHIRGCWLIDAILNGSWAKPPKPKQQPKNRLLSKLPKFAQLDITTTMAGDGALPLEEFLARRWDVEGDLKSQLYGDPTKRLTEAITELSKSHPELTGEQIRILLSLRESIRNLGDVALARRAALDDPAELARGLSVAQRVTFALRGHKADYQVYPDFPGMCAAGELSLAQSMAVERRAGERAIPTDWQLADIGMTAILQDDFNMLQRVTLEIAQQKKVQPYLGGLYAMLTGVATAQPKLVAGGIETVLDSEHKARDKSSAACVINLAAHGLYRLCESVDPALVADFDVLRPHPWDASFHEWCKSHPDPLEGIDLSRISPILHDVVILRQLPAWLPKPEPLYELVLIDPGSKAPANVIALAGASTKAARQQVMRSLPVVLCWNLIQQKAERYCRDIAEVGGIAEVRIMQPTPFRFVEPIG